MPSKKIPKIGVKSPPIFVPRLTHQDDINRAELELLHALNHPASIMRGPKTRLVKKGQGVHSDRSYTNTPWAAIDAALSDARYLSFEARMALIWFLCRGPKYVFYAPVKNLMATSGYGRTKCCQIMRELRCAGHAYRICAPHRHVPNAWVWFWKFSERPCGLPESKLRYANWVVTTPQYAVHGEDAKKEIPVKGKPNLTRPGYESAKLVGMRPYADFDPAPSYSSQWRVTPEELAAVPEEQLTELSDEEIDYLTEEGADVDSLNIMISTAGMTDGEAQAAGLPVDSSRARKRVLAEAAKAAGDAGKPARRKRGRPRTTDLQTADSATTQSTTTTAQPKTLAKAENSTEKSRKNIQEKSPKNTPSKSESDTTSSQKLNDVEVSKSDTLSKGRSPRIHGKRLTSLPVRSRHELFFFKRRVRKAIRKRIYEEQLNDDPSDKIPDLGPERMNYGPHGRGWRKGKIDVVGKPLFIPGTPNTDIPPLPGQYPGPWDSYEQEPEPMEYLPGYEPQPVKTWQPPVQQHIRIPGYPYLVDLQELNLVLGCLVSELGCTPSREALFSRLESHRQLRGDETPWQH